MSEASRLDEQIWERAWEGHALAQGRRMASLPLWEKLAWLESAQRLAEFLGRSRATAPSDENGAVREPEIPRD